MSLAIKKDTDIEQLRAFGFALGEELAERPDFANYFIGREYQLSWWHKVNLTEINPEAIATMGMMKNRFAAFTELSDAETPAVDTRVHLRVLEHVEGWFEAPKEEEAEKTE